MKKHFLAAAFVALVATPAFAGGGMSPFFFGGTDDAGDGGGYIETVVGYIGTLLSEIVTAVIS